MAVEKYTVPEDRIIHKTKVDFTQRCVQKTVHVVQYDSSLPIVAVELFMNGSSYTLPNNASVKVRWGKRDHTFVIKEVLGCDESRKVVYFDVDEQMTFYNGSADPILELTISDHKAGSSSIPFFVDRNPVQNGDVESYSKYPEVEQTMEDVKKINKIIPEDASETNKLASEKYVNEHGGSSVTVDTEMSDTSTNPVQNKVIKAYVDTSVNDLAGQFDDAMFEHQERLDDHDARIHNIERDLGHIELENADIEDIVNDIRNGYAKDYYSVGEQLIIDYIYSNTTYSCPHNVVSLEDAVIWSDIIADYAVTYAMTLEWDYTIPLGLAFDPDEAIMVVGANGMGPGTYYFKVAGDSWASQNGKYIQFTVTDNLTTGMHLKPSSSYNTVMAGAKMRVYADSKSFSVLHEYAMSEGQTGIYLGEMYSKTDQGNAATYLAKDNDHNVYINHYHRAFLGYNRWRDSLYRQWLNASGLNWWTAQNIFDRAPSNIASLYGFLSGYDQKFINAIRSSQIQTYTNAITDDGSVDTTYDKVFLHSMAELNVDGFSSQQNTGGLEGESWDYYKDLAMGESNLNRNGTFKAWATYPSLINYALNAKTSAQYVFSRSALRSNGISVLYVTASGDVSHDLARNGYRCLPACRIG